MVLGSVAASLLICSAFLGANAVSNHTNNWAVLINSSRYWMNYRHVSNTLGIYRTVKRLGIPDSNIILMLADDFACDPRNSVPATIYANKDRKLDLYGEQIEVDYRDYEVNVENVIRVLTDRVEADTPVSKRLLSDDKSNVLVYMTGHGGDEFLKFQDQEEISAHDIGDAFEQMWGKRRYHKLLFMIDTCQATTMTTQIRSPNILATGSSLKGQNSYSHHSDPLLGIAVIDRFTHHVLNFLEGVNATSPRTMRDLFDTYSRDLFASDAGVMTHLLDPSDILLTDFFGGVSPTIHIPRAISDKEINDLLAVSKGTQQSSRQPIPKKLPRHKPAEIKPTIEHKYEIIIASHRYQITPQSTAMLTGAIGLIAFAITQRLFTKREHSMQAVALENGLVLVSNLHTAAGASFADHNWR